MDQQAGFTSNTQATKAPVRQLARLKRGLRRLSGKRDEPNDDIAYIAQSGAFDREYYLAQYPDVRSSGKDPLAHFVAHGAEERRNPSATFDTGYYLDHYPDVAASGMNPLRHFLQFGAAESRKPFRSGSDAAKAPDDYAVIDNAGVFDHAYYLKAYPDVAAKGADPIRHYLSHGAKEGKNPSAWFDTTYYLANNADVVAAGLNPLAHFCRYGHRELRNPSAGFDIAWYWLTQLAESEPAANPLAHFMGRSTDRVAGVREVGQFSAEDREWAQAIANNLLEQGGQDAVCAMRLGVALSRLAKWVEAEKALSTALGLNWKDARAHARLAGVLARQSKWWQAAESWSSATDLDSTHADWFFRLGEAQEKMNRFELAAQGYRRAIELQPGNPQWLYQLGFVYEKAGQRDRADAAYGEAVALDGRKNTKTFGIGVFHQARGFWPEAAQAYATEVERNPAMPELHFRLGMAQDRCYRWEQAEQSYRNAIALKPEMPSWHYRYGFVMERQERYPEAAEAYAAAATLSDRREPYWWYRRGYALAQAGRYEEACQAYLATRERPELRGGDSESCGSAGTQVSWLGDYLKQFPSEDLLSKALATDTTNADAHYRLGEARERREDWSAAAEAYAAAADRSDDHCPDWYYRLGYVLACDGRFEDACNAFRQIQLIQRPCGVELEPLAKESRGTRLTTIYVEFMETLPIRDNVIMYESHIGKSVSCNPLGIFEKLIADPHYNSYLHVWVLNDKTRIPDNLKALPNVIVTSRLSNLYLRYIATAKYLINNTNLPIYFVRRKEQKYLATWHGTPLKTLGKQQTYNFLEHKRTQRNFLQATHIISPNPHTTNILFDSYDIRHIMSGCLAETGYPRVDLTLNASVQRREAIRRQLGVNGKRPVVLYAPTWRGTLETVSYDIERAKKDLRHLASHHDCDVVFRGHHLMEAVFASGDMTGCTVVPESIDTNELLSVVDVLVTDYSSIFFDFLPTGRPVLYYVYDQETYEKERGLYFSMDEMPGYKCRDIASLDAALELALKGQLHDTQHHARALEAFNGHDDGQAAERVIKFFFHDDASYVVDSGPRAPISLLIHGGGFKRNGITTSFLNLVKHLDRSKVQITVVVSPEGVEGDAECMESFERLPTDINIVGRCGIMAMSWEERWLRGHYEKSRSAFTGERLDHVRNLFDREYMRILGESRFDVAVSFSGYDSFWTSILCLNERGLRKVIYMHSDMFAEYVARFPDLVRMFNLYGFADKLVSVCKESCRDNQKHLSSWLGISPDRFVVCENVQDPVRIIELSHGPVEEEDEYLFGRGPVFINVGRLSVEKDQAKLIRSFSQVCATHPEAQLIILGDGPLRNVLSDLVRSLGLIENVHLLGVRNNPYAYMRRSGCFVLSSNHEARCMSLMEALIVGIPCVATDISGNSDIKADFPQYFFDNSEDGLRVGMQKYLAGRMLPPELDVMKYQVEALEQFESRVLGTGV